MLLPIVTKVTGGSSPHTRGARRGAPGSRRLTGDHPRIRGEHVRVDPSGQPGGGSSPHTRGAPSPISAEANGTRIIPAYAGSTGPSCSPAPTARDHPRIRGEHEALHPRRPDGRGSSPHTRGAQRGRRESHDSGRIIPAYAGSTPPWFIGTAGSSDHPRIRGEHGPSGRIPHADRGSSPHTRGALHPTRRHRPRPRIIPAYAGSTAARRPRTGRGPDHPRIRGEHGLGGGGGLLDLGSSPHTRGAP